MHLRDDAGAVRALVAEPPGAPDLVITSGGVSMGVYDIVKEVLSARRWRRVRPGRDAPGDAAGLRAASAATRTPVVTLPGNPVSSFVSFHVFVLPALRRLAGSRPRRRRLVRRAWPTPGGRPVPGKVELTRVVETDGRVRPSGGQGSHVLGALAGATALALVPAEVERVEPGDRRALPPPPRAGSLAVADVTRAGPRG